MLGSLTRGRHHGRVLARALASVGLSFVAFGVSSTTAGAASLSLEQWAAGYVAFVGGGSVGVASPRVRFLEKWATVEGTFYLGNVFNPLDTEMPAPDAGLWNSAGVRTYPTLAEGYQATLATMQQSYDAPILSALRRHTSTLPSLTKALTDSNWTGAGPQSSDESGYAGVVRGSPVGPAGPLGPSSPTTVGSASELVVKSISKAILRGNVVNPLGQGLDGVCVAAVPTGGLAVNAVTTTGGAFQLDDVPETSVRLRITDCDFLEGGVGPSYYDADAGRRKTSQLASRASVIDLNCERNCVQKVYRLHDNLVYGTAAVAISWPQPAAITYGAVLSGAELDASAPVPGTFSYSPALGASLGAGTHTLALTFTPADRTDFQVVQSSVSLTVDKATPSVNWPAPAPITYGTALSGVQLDATAAVGGSFSYLFPTAVGTILGAGSQTLRAIFTPDDAADYATVSSSTPLQVQPAEPVVSLTTSGTVAAGSTLSTAELKAHASVPGSFTYSPPLGSAVPLGTETVAVEFTPLDAADYLSAAASVTLDATQSVPSLTWTQPHAVVAGTALSATQLDATASVPGTFSYSPPSGAVLDPGDNTLTVTFTPADASAYTSASAQTTLLVDPLVDPTITWPTPSPVAAGTVLSATQLDATASVPGTFTYSPPLGTALSAGTTTISATFTPADGAAFATVSARVSVVVMASPPTTFVVTSSTSAAPTTS